MKNFSAKTWWTLTVILAFASVISFFQIDSALADEKNLNSLFTTFGVVCGLGAIFSLYKVKTLSN